MPTLSISLFASLQITLKGAPVTSRLLAKPQALLAYLSVEAGVAHPRGALAGLLWPDQPEEAARNSLRQALHQLRRVLGESAASLLVVTPKTVQFEPAGDYECWLDVAEFKELVHARESHSHEWVETCPVCMEQLQRAMDLYQGDFLAQFFLKDSIAFEEWALVTREALRREALAALHLLGKYYTLRGEYGLVEQAARRQIKLDPFLEEAHQQVMRALAWRGERSAAMAQYKACSSTLAQELDVEPSAETTRLFEQIRDGDSQALVPPPAFLHTLYASPAPFFEEDKFERPTFVARERELARLDNLLQTALAGQGGVVLITGEAGQGKTALIQEFVCRAHAAHSNLLAADGCGNAYTGIGDPYLPFRQVLGSLTGDIEARWLAGDLAQDQARRLWHALPLAAQALVEAGPDLVGGWVPAAALTRRAAAASLITPGKTYWLRQLEKLIESRTRNADQANLQPGALFDQYVQVVRMLARRHPLLLVLDDLQWADAGSISLLFHLGRHIEGSRILVVCAYRPAELAQGRAAEDGARERHPLASAANEFKRRFGDIELNLDQTQDRQFVDAFLDTEPNRLGTDFREALYRQTRGHPLFTVELIQSLRERGELVRDEQGQWIVGLALDWEKLPVRVEAVVAERIERLPRPLRVLLEAACVEGEDFTAEVVARVLGADEQETLERLRQELEMQHCLVRACGVQPMGSCYRFQHIMFQRYLYTSLHPAKRKHLHESVGTTLEALRRQNAEEEADSAVPQLAWHFQEAGLADKAAGYWRQAGDRARRLYALPEAVDYYQRAIECLRECGEQEQTARILMTLGLTHHLAFDFQRARQAYEEGFALWRRMSEEPVALPPAPHALRIDCPYLPLSLDPAMAGDVDSTSVIDQLFSGLVSLSPELEVVPEVAYSWQVGEGGRSYVFHLRDDEHWSDGRPVTARDFEYAWKRALNPATGSPIATLNMLYEVKGARAFHQREMPDADGVGVRALDEFTLAVELEQPASHFLYLLAHAASFPAPWHVVELYGNAWADAGNIVGNGPFRLEPCRQDGALVLSRNPAYNRRFTGNVEQVELRPVSDISARLAAYQADQLDVLFLWNPSQERERARRRHASEYITAPWLATTYAGFDTSRPPFDDLRVRWAFALAADKEAFANIVLQGYAFPATGGFIPPGMAGHSAGIGRSCNLDQARVLLTQAGYLDGRGFPPVEFLTDESSSQSLAAQWQKDLGVEIAWTRTSWEDLIERLENEPPHIFLATWYADYPDPDNFLRVCDAIRWTRWQNSAYQELVKKARQVTDQGERMAMYYRADQTLVEEAALVPVAYRRLNLLVKPWVRKFPASAIKWWHWKDIVIEPHG